MESIHMRPPSDSLHFCPLLTMFVLLLQRSLHVSKVLRHRPNWYAGKRNQHTATTRAEIEERREWGRGGSSCPNRQNAGIPQQSLYESHCKYAAQFGMKKECASLGNSYSYTEKKDFRLRRRKLTLLHLLLRCLGLSLIK